MSDRQYVHHEDEVQLAKILKQSRPWFETYGTTIIYGAAAVLAVAAIVVYFARRPPATAAESGLLLVARTPEDFASIADKTPDSPIGISSRLRSGELTLRNAFGNLYTNRETALKELDEAEKIFKKLADQNLSPELRIRVLVGLARIIEARCDGSEESVNASVAAWEKVLTEFPDSKMFKDVAEDRKKKLQLESTKSFYAWFQKQDPKPGDDLLLPQDGPGSVPDIPKLDIPDFTVPPAPTSSTTPPAETTEPTAPPATPTENAAPAEAPATDPAAPTGESTPASPPADGAAPASTTEPAAPATPPATEAPAADPATPPATPEKSGE